MKRIAMLPVIMLLSLQSYAQWIGSISVSPPNPLSTDTIYVYVSCSFPSGNCDAKTQYISINGNTISAYALHCLGIASFICGETDTFQINPLPPGPYTFIFQVDYGMLPSPCTPGIAPGPVDSVVFHVVAPTGIEQHGSGVGALQLLQGTNPRSFICRMPETTNWPVELFVYNGMGQLMLRQLLTANNQELDLSSPGAGIYLVTTDANAAAVKIRLE